MPPFTVFENLLGDMTLEEGVEAREGRANRNKRKEKTVGVELKNKKEEHKYRNARKENKQDHIFVVARKEKSEQHTLETAFKDKIEEQELGLNNSDKTAFVFTDQSKIEDELPLVAFKGEEEKILSKPNNKEETFEIACKDRISALPSTLVSPTFPHNIEAPNFIPRPPPNTLPGLVYYPLPGPLLPHTFLPIYHQPGLPPNLQLEQAHMQVMPGHLQPPMPGHIQPLYIPSNFSPGHYLAKPQPALPPLFPVPPPSPPHLQAWQHQQTWMQPYGDSQAPLVQPLVQPLAPLAPADRSEWRRPARGLCYRCHQPGHRARQCI